MLELLAQPKPIADGHQVSVFFAASGTRILDRNFVDQLDKEIGPESTVVSGFMESIISNATLYCSFASVYATLGHREGDHALLVDDDKIQWSGPPGVIHLATNSDVQLTY